VAEVRYLGELYCEKVVDSRLVFDTLFKIVTYGHEGGVPKSGSINPLDLPDDFFRIRLVCTLLDVLGDLVEVFDRGPAKKKLDFFLTFLQYYIATKEDLPMDTDFLVQDTFYKLRPQWKLLTSLEEAGKAFAEVVKLNYQNAPGTAAEDEQEEESGTDDDNDETSLRNKEEADRSSGEEADENPNGVESPDLDTGDEEEEEEHIVVTRPEDERDPEIDADFDRELAKLMAESVESRKFERKPMFDVPLPMRKRVENNNGVLPEDTTNNNANSSTNNDQPAPISPLPSTMKFSLLSKKGNRQQTRSIDLPADSTFAVAMKSQQQAETEEKQRIKNLVLNYDLSSTSVDDDGEYDPLSLHPPPLQRNTNKERAAGLYDGHGKRGLEHRQRRRHSGGGKMVQPPQVRLQGNGGLKNPSMTLARHLHSPRQVGRGNEQHNKNNHPSPISTHNNPKQAETPIPSNKKSPAAPAVQAQVQDRQAFPSLSSATAELGKKTDNHKNTFAYDTVHDAAIEKQPQNPYNTPRIDKAGTSARMQRGRRLDLSDLDW
jgi:regulator of nonsense transcripts 2